MKLINADVYCRLVSTSDIFPGHQVQLLQRREDGAGGGDRDDQEPPEPDERTRVQDGQHAQAAHSPRAAGLHPDPTPRALQEGKQTQEQGQVHFNEFHSVELTPLHT